MSTKRNTVKCSPCTMSFKCLTSQPFFGVYELLTSGLKMIKLYFDANIFTARVRSTREGNVLTRVCPSINLSVHRGGYPYPIMLCNISQNAMRWGGYPDPPWGGTQVRYPPWLGTPPGGGGTRVRYPPGGGYPGQVPPRGGYPGQVPPRGGTRVRYPPGGVTRVRYPPGGGGTRVGQQKEYSLHGGRYASCVHAGGLSCSVNI